MKDLGRQDYESISKEPISGISKMYPCILERLLLHGDFNSLKHLLHACIWQRFSLSSNEFSENGPDIMNNELSVSVTQDFPQRNLDLVHEVFTDSENMPDVLCEVEEDNGMLGLHYVCDLDSATRTYLPSEGTSSISSAVSGSALLLPWFMLSAVFTGCPKLLQYLMLQNEEYISECSRNDQVNGDSSKESLKQLANQGTTIGVSQSVNVTMPSCENNTACSHMSEYPTSDRVLPGNTGQQFSTSLDMTHQLVNVKVACEFPITDTWIHQSVNLLISPLHLACWRHDFTSIMMLLQNGADPNDLALEQILNENIHELIRLDRIHTDKPKFSTCTNGLYFYKDRGLSPLHFIALGLRSPPRHSVLQGCRAGIIHDPFACFWELKRSESSNIDDKTLLNNKLYTYPQFSDWSRTVCETLTSSGQSSLDEKSEADARCELVVSCLQVLLQAGANPNVGYNLVLKGAYPLDIFLQPPTRVYYAPSAARGNQSSISLRVQDLEHNVNQVVSACQILLSHDARLSPSFISTYMWRPELLDCFHIKDTHNSWQLVSFLIRQGLFSDTFLHEQRTSQESDSVRVSTIIVIHRFIADVMNTSISPPLTQFILNWSSVTLLHGIIKAVAKIAEKSGWNSRLRELSDMVFCMQLRTLKHACLYVILSTVQYRFSAIWSLPLPARLKRELTDLCL